MTLRLNTVVYAFDTRKTNLATATRNDFSAVTLTIAETVSRTIRSARVVIGARTNPTTAADLSAFLIGIKLGAVAFDDRTITATYSSGGRNPYIEVRRDVTSYFATNFGSATTQTCQVGVTFTGSSTINVYAYVVITYEYDDTNQDLRTKTIPILLDSTTGALTNALAEIGTNQVPNLGSYLPESTISYKQKFFEVNAHEGTSGTTDFSLALALDAEAEVVFGSLENQNNSPTRIRCIWVRDDMTTSATHAFKARCNNVTSRIQTPGVILWVTYTYDHAATQAANGRVINSIRVPLLIDGDHKGGELAAAAGQIRKSFFIEEPGTITLVQSGLHVTGMNFYSGDASIGILAGSQTERVYALFSASASGSQSGEPYFQHRIDSGGAAGAGITLARGENTLAVQLRYTISSGSPISLEAVSAVLYLNYTSDIHAAGAGAHNHTVDFVVEGTEICDDVNAYPVRSTPATAPNIPETNYWINAFGLETHRHFYGRGFVHVAAQYAVTEGAAGAGWQQLGWSGYHSAEAMSHHDFYAAEKYFDRHPLEPDTARMAVETTRVYRLLASTDQNSGVNSFTSLSLLVTYHSITQTVQRAVSGYTGGGGSLTVDIHRKSTQEMLYSVTTIAGGQFTFVSYDNTVTCYCEVYQDGTHVGRSVDFIPSGLYP